MYIFRGLETALTPPSIYVITAWIGRVLFHTAILPAAKRVGIETSGTEMC